MEHPDRTPLGTPSFATSGGEGEASYSRNSCLQASLGACLVPILKEALLHSCSLPQAGPIHYADFGCSVGANTIDYAKAVAESLKLKQDTRGRDVFCYFCDLPSNDFNTLFNQQPPFVDQASSDDSVEERTWFAAGVPGSMFDRMFPRSSLHIAISTLAIHYLPEIPKSIMDKNSPAYNKGHIWIPGSSPAVAAAYAEALRKGMRTFFERRAEEMASGGLLGVLCIGRKDRARPENQYLIGCIGWHDVLQDTFVQLVHEGVIAEELLDSLNFPICHPSLDELREAIEQPTSAFHIQKLEYLENVPALPDDVKETLFKDAESYAKFHKNLAVAGSSFTSGHLGPDVFEKLIERLGYNHMKEYPKWKATHFPWNVDLCVAALIRK